MYVDGTGTDLIQRHGIYRWTERLHSQSSSRNDIISIVLPNPVPFQSQLAPLLWPHHHSSSVLERAIPFPARIMVHPFCSAAFN